MTARPDGIYRNRLPFGWLEVPLGALSNSIEEAQTWTPLHRCAISLGLAMKWFSDASEETICLVATSKGRSSAAERGALNPEVGGSNPPAPATYTRWWYDKQGQLHRTVTDEEGTWDVNTDLAKRMMDLV